MFVINFKLDFKKILMVCIAVSIISAIFIEFASNNNVDSEYTMKKDDSKYDYILTDENYLQILKEVHDNAKESVDKTIRLNGFVFRMDGFKENTFVCGRNTIVEGEDNVAGFLCESNDTSKLKDGEWIEIIGVIKESEDKPGTPIIKIGSITKITAPANTFVQ